MRPVSVPHGLEFCGRETVLRLFWKIHIPELVCPRCGPVYFDVHHGRFRRITTGERTGYIPQFVDAICCQFGIHRYSELDDCTLNWVVKSVFLSDCKTVEGQVQRIICLGSFPNSDLDNHIVKKVVSFNKSIDGISQRNPRDR